MGSASVVIGGRSNVLAWTLETGTGSLPARSTVTVLPPTGEFTDAQLVASVSSISLARLIPSPLAVAPDVPDARLRDMTSGSVRSPGRTCRLNFLLPNPAP